MSILERAVGDLREIASELLAAPERGLVDTARVARRIGDVAAILADEDARWIGTTEAKRLLGLSSENTVKAWARSGLLRHRKLANKRTQVLLDDVLARRAEEEDLTAIPGGELSPDEVRVLRETRPGSNPWQRERRQISR
jgi:hypothetical protein